MGSFEGDLRSMILKEDPGRPEDVAVILGRFEERSLTVMLDPHPETIEGISFCRFYLTGFVAYRKIDQKSLLNHLRACICVTVIRLLYLLGVFTRAKTACL